jgi:hypothetical protein
MLSIPEASAIQIDGSTRYSSEIRGEEHETYPCHREAPQGAVAIPARRPSGRDCFASLAMTRKLGGSRAMPLFNKNCAPLGSLNHKILNLGTFDPYQEIYAA